MILPPNPSNSTDKLYMLLLLAEKYLAQGGPQPKRVKLTWLITDDSALPEVEIEWP